MNVRKMRNDDYRAVHGLWKTDGNVGLRKLDDSEEGFRKFLTRNPDTNFVAVENDVIAGTILCGHDGRRAYIYHLFVSPSFRLRGIATELVETVVKSLREIGITKVGLTVFAENEKGNAFWESVGFTRRKDLYYRNKSINDLNE